MNFYNMGNKIPVVARLEFCMWRNTQPDLHLLEAKQMEDFSILSEAASADSCFWEDS